MRLCALLFTFYISGSALIFLGGCSTFVSHEDEDRARLLLRMGASQMEAGDYPNALRTLISAEQLNPEDPVIQNNLGLAYFFRDRLDLAEKHLRLSLSLKDDYTEARNNLGRVLTERGKYQEAIDVLAHALKDLTYSKPARIYLNLGIAQFGAKQHDEARTNLRKVLQYGQDNCLAQNYLGRSYFEGKDFKSASEILDRAVGFCQANQFDEPHYYSALAYYQLGEKAQAESRLEQVTKLYPNGKYTEQAKSLLETIRR